MTEIVSLFISILYLSGVVYYVLQTERNILSLGIILTLSCFHDNPTYRLADLNQRICIHFQRDLANDKVLVKMEELHGRQTDSHSDYSAHTV